MLKNLYTIVITSYQHMRYCRESLFHCNERCETRGNDNHSLQLLKYVYLPLLPFQSSVWCFLKRVASRACQVSQKYCLQRNSCSFQIFPSEVIDLKVCVQVFSEKGSSRVKVFFILSSSNVYQNEALSGKRLHLGNTLYALNTEHSPLNRDQLDAWWGNILVFRPEQKTTSLFTRYRFVSLFL